VRPRARRCRRKRGPNRIFLAADSLVGPSYLVAGKTFGGGAAIYLMWGRPR